MTFVKVEAAVTTPKNLRLLEFKVIAVATLQFLCSKFSRDRYDSANDVIFRARYSKIFSFQNSKLERDGDPGRIAICDVVLYLSQYNEHNLFLWARSPEARLLCPSRRWWEATFYARGWDFGKDNNRVNTLFHFELYLLAVAHLTRLIINYTNYNPDSYYADSLSRDKKCRGSL